MRGTLRHRAGAWRLQVFAGRDPITGKEKRVTRTFHAPDTRAGRKAAERALAELVLEVESGMELRHRDTTFAELCARWLTARTSTWSPSTLRINRRMVDRHLLPELGQLRVWKLRAHHLDTLYARLAASGLAPGSVRRVHALVHAALAQAVRWDMVARNVADAATPPSTSGRANTDTTPAPADLARVIAAVDDDPAMAAFLRLAATTGARRGQLCALRWTDLDLEHGVVRYARGITKGDDGWVERGTKTGRIHQAALSPDVVAHLVRLREHAHEVAAAARAPYPADAHVFSRGVDGATPWAPDSVSQRWRRLRARHGLDGVRFHDVRHFVATQLIAAGMDPRTVADRLGHAGPNVTLGVYSHLVPARDQAAAEMLDGILNPAPAPRSGGRARATPPPGARRSPRRRARR